MHLHTILYNNKSWYTEDNVELFDVLVSGSHRTFATVQALEYMNVIVDVGDGV